LFVVFGASGLQGGAVIDSFLRHKNLTEKFRLRALVSDPNSASAKNLVSRGIEIKQFDIKDANSIEKAVEGAYVVFAVTMVFHDPNFNEWIQGKNIVDSCKRAGVVQFIYGSLPDSMAISNG